MNKFIILLICTTLSIWGVFLFKMSNKLTNEKQENQEIPAVSNKMQVLNFNDLFTHLNAQSVAEYKDPFNPPEINPSKKVTKQKVQESPLTTPAPINPPPPITLDAILPGDKPVAILKYKGESVVVSLGDNAWGATVISIEENKVKLTFEERVFIIP